MRKTYKYKLYPNMGQRFTLQWTLDKCRLLYNCALEQRITAYNFQSKTSISCYDQINELPFLKKEIISYKKIHSQILYDVLNRLDKSYKNFFRRIKTGEKPGFPRFQGYHRYDSFTYLQSGFKINGNRLFLSKIGHIKMKQSRPTEGRIKTCTIKKEGSNWFVCFSCIVEPKPLELREEPIAVGIDLGIKNYAVLSNGSFVENPRFIKKSESLITERNQFLARKKRGSNRRKKTLDQLRKTYLKVRNQRNDFLHKLSHKLVSLYDIIVMEKLSITNMMTKIASINKSTLDASWSTLIGFIAYKAEYAGKQLILVNPAGTSQQCSLCDLVLEKRLLLKDRIFKCTCGFEEDRDLNAATNILNRGLCQAKPSKRLGQSPRECERARIPSLIASD